MYVFECLEFMRPRSFVRMSVGAQNLCDYVCMYVCMYVSVCSAESARVNVYV